MRYLDILFDPSLQVLNASWKNRKEVGVSLLAAAELDVKDAILLEAELKVFNQSSSQTGRGPTPSTMNARRADREVDAAGIMGRDMAAYGFEDDSDDEGNSIRPTKSSRKKTPSNVRMFATQSKKAEKFSKVMKIRDYEVNSSLRRTFKVSNSNKGRTVYNVSVSNVCTCSCSYVKKHRGLIYCHHIVFVVFYVLSARELKDSLINRYIGDEDLKRVFDKAGPQISEDFMQRKPNILPKEQMQEILENHPLFQNLQTWSHCAKEGRSAKCFRCKVELLPGAMCLSVDGALCMQYGGNNAYLRRCFCCPRKSCASYLPYWTNIRRPTNFIDDATKNFISALNLT